MIRYDRINMIGPITTINIFRPSRKLVLLLLSQLCFTAFDPSFILLLLLGGFLYFSSKCLAFPTFFYIFLTVSLIA